MIPRIQLSKQGPEFSRLVYGTWRLLSDAAGATPRALCDRLSRCADLGITTIDTAEIYGGYAVERAIGEALALDPALRARLEIVSKAGIYVPVPQHPERKVAFYDASAAQLIRSVEESLRLLRTDHLDLFLVHRPDWLTAADETADGLNRLLREGKILSAGVSNYSVHQFETLNVRMERPLATNQVEFSLLHIDPIFDGTADQCQRLGIAPMAWSPLAQGRLMKSDDEAGARVQTLAAELAPKYDGATVDQLAFAWLLAHPARPLPIIGTNRMDRIESVARSVSIALAREDWYALWSAAQGRRIP